MRTTSATAPAEALDNRFPRQIKYIVGNEACERFSYYGMRGILAGYIAGEVARGGLAKSQDEATTIIHLFGFANYFMPLVGAWISDRFWGRYRTILWISLFYCLGHGVLAMSEFTPDIVTKTWLLYGGLALIAFGAGGIKPCVSAFMGDQFKPSQGHLMEKAYGVFYWSINFGSFFSFLVIPRIKDSAGYGVAFGVPGILMAIATLIFWLGTRHYVRIPPARDTKTAGFLQVYLVALRNQAGGISAAAWVNVLTTLVLPVTAIVGLLLVALNPGMASWVRVVGWGALGAVALWYLLLLWGSLTGNSELPARFWQAARSRFNDDEIAAASSVSPILFVLALIPLFFALFEQSASTWVLQGFRMESVAVPTGLRWLVGDTLGAEQMQSMNPLFVMILVPLLTLVVYPTVNRVVKVTQLRRIGLGLAITACSYVVVAFIQQRIDQGARMSVLWQTIPYLILTIGEVLVSTTGLEFAYTQAARSMKSTIMSFFLLTIAFGHLLVSGITALGGGHASDASVTPQRFLLYACMTFAVAGAFALVSSKYRYRTWNQPTTGAVAPN